MIKGHCECGKVTFEVDGEILDFSHCHCSQCRRLHGAAYGTFAGVARDQFRLVSGFEDIETVSPVPPYKYKRSFCRQCGTSLGEPLSSDETFSINAHCLDADPGVRNAFHEFVSERPDWAKWLKKRALRPFVSCSTL